MRVTEVPRSPAQGPRLVVWLIQGTPYTTVRLWQLCHVCGEDALTELPPPLLEGAEASDLLELITPKRTRLPLRQTFAARS
jgi:hypothetical protein